MGGLSFSKPRPLEDGDSIDGFSCGVCLVDEWLSKRGRTARRQGDAVVYVSFCGDRLAGFYTLSSQSITREGLQGWLGRNAPRQIPVILLGMLGVDSKYQKEGLGRALLLDASKRAKAVAQSIGARALVVDPYDDATREFYGSCGFRALPDTNRMYAKLG